MLIFVGVVVALALAAGGYLLFRSKPKVEEPAYYHRCVKCKRRMRYRKEQAGRHAVCPTCRNQFVIPAVPAK